MQWKCASSLTRWLWVWIISQYSLKLMTKLQAYLFFLITQRMQNLQFVWVKIQVTRQDVPYTPVRHAYHLSVLMCRLPQTVTDGCQHSGNVLGHANWGQLSKWHFTHERSFYMPLPYPATNCIWRWCFLLIEFAEKSVLSLCNRFCPNKEFHSTNMFFSSPVLHVNLLWRALL